MFHAQEKEEALSHDRCAPLQPQPLCSTHERRRITKGEEEREELGLAITLAMLITLQKLVKHRITMPL
jgi:hypothetical protein